MRGHKSNSKAIAVKLQLFEADRITADPEPRFGKKLYQYDDLVMFPNDIEYVDFVHSLIQRTKDREAIPADSEHTERLIALTMGSSTQPSMPFHQVVDALNWEAGRHMLLSKPDATLEFWCMIVDKTDPTDVETRSCLGGGWAFKEPKEADLVPNRGRIREQTENKCVVQ